jgi:hypothetical protein
VIPFIGREAAYMAERMNGRLKEMANRHLVISRALARGFNAFVPIVDQGIDFILHRATDNRLLKVQLKSRWTIDRKYERYQDLWIAFPSGGEWYLMLIATATKLGIYVNSVSWSERGSYSTDGLSKELLKASELFQLDVVLAENGDQIKTSDTGHHASLLANSLVGRET